MSLENEELSSLRSINRELKINIKRYKEFVDNFKEDEEKFWHFVERK